MQPALQLVERVRKIADRRPHSGRLNRQWSRVDQRRADRTLRLAEALDIQPNAVSGEQRLENLALREQALPRLVIRGLAKSFAMRVTEDVRKEHVGVLAIRLEQENVGLRILAAVFFHPHFHPGVDDRPERLRQHQREPALVDLLDRQPAVASGRARVERHQRIDT
jgi:hypothetical protein